MMILFGFGWMETTKNFDRPNFELYICVLEVDMRILIVCSVRNEEERC